MSEVVFGIPSGPWVVRDDDALRIRSALRWGNSYGEMVLEFVFPASETHLVAMQDDLVRHLLLRSALEAVCRRAEPTRDSEVDTAAAARAIDVVLLSSEGEVEEYVATEGLLVAWVDRQHLVAHGGDPDLLADGRPFAALRGRATIDSDWTLVTRQEPAETDRYWRQEATRLGALNTAVLRYIGMFDMREWAMGRYPEAVEPDLLDDVLAIVATADAGAAKHAKERREGPFIEAVQKYVAKRHSKLDETAAFRLARLVERERHQG